MTETGGAITVAQFRARTSRLLREYSVSGTNIMTIKDATEAAYLLEQGQLIDAANPREAFGLVHEMVNSLQNLLRCRAPERD